MGGLNEENFGGGRGCIASLNQKPQLRLSASPGTEIITLASRGGWVVFTSVYTCRSQRHRHIKCAPATHRNFRFDFGQASRHANISRRELHVASTLGFESSADVKHSRRVFLYNERRSQLLALSIYMSPGSSGHGRSLEASGHRHQCCHAFTCRSVQARVSPDTRKTIALTTSQPPSRAFRDRGCIWAQRPAAGSEARIYQGCFCRCAHLYLSKTRQTQARVHLWLLSLVNGTCPRLPGTP